MPTGGLAAGSALEALATADAVWCSPLTRALQTCLVGLKPLLLGRGLAVQLRKNAREPQHLTDLNSRGVEMGAAAMLRRATDKLREVMGERADSPELADLEGAPVESVEVEERWWDESASETGAQLALRLDELMRQIQYAPYEKIVLVTHGSIIAGLLAAHLAPSAVHAASAAVSSGSAHEEMVGGPPAEGKVDSCAIVCCKLDFARASRVIRECSVIKPQQRHHPITVEAQSATRDPGPRVLHEGPNSASPAAPAGNGSVRPAPIWRPNIIMRS
jgi:broad specificity phosphatase PhoE